VPETQLFVFKRKIGADADFAAGLDIVMSAATDEWMTHGSPRWDQVADFYCNFSCLSYATDALAKMSVRVIHRRIRAISICLGARAHSNTVTLHTLRAAPRLLHQSLCV
jgi:hypothetical protein